METDLFSSFIKMVSALALVLGLMFVLFYLARKTVLRGQGMAPAGKVIKMIASHGLGPKKSIAVVNVAGEFLVLGIGAERITLLSKLESSSSLETLMQSLDVQNGQSFTSILGNVLSTAGRGKKKAE